MSNDKQQFDTVSWEKAWELIREVVPNATFATPESLCVAAEKYGRIIETVPWNNETDDDRSIWMRIAQFFECDPEVVIITDCSFPDTKFKPFRASSNIDDFIASSKNYGDKYGECVFSGMDVIVICPVSRLLILFFHEGGCFLVRAQQMAAGSPKSVISEWRLD